MFGDHYFSFSLSVGVALIKQLACVLTCQLIARSDAVLVHSLSRQLIVSCQRVAMPAHAKDIAAVSKQAIGQWCTELDREEFVMRSKKRKYTMSAHADPEKVVKYITKVGAWCEFQQLRGCASKKRLAQLEQWKRTSTATSGPRISRRFSRRLTMWSLRFGKT